MLYLVNFEIKNTTREANFIANVEGNFPQRNRCLPHSYFLLSDLDKNELYNRLRQGLENEDLILVVAVPDHALMGWLPSSSVDWISTNYNL